MTIDLGERYKTQGGWFADVLGSTSQGLIVVHLKLKNHTLAWHNEDGMPHYFNGDFNLIEKVDTHETEDSTSAQTY